MGSKEARNSRKALCLHSWVYCNPVQLQLATTCYTWIVCSDGRVRDAISWSTVMGAQRDSRRQRGGGERRGVVAARWALAARSLRTRRPALKMESTGGVRLRLGSTIHSKFVFSRNRTGGVRPSDRLPDRAATCSARGLVEVHVYVGADSPEAAGLWDALM